MGVRALQHKIIDPCLALRITCTCLEHRHTWANCYSFRRRFCWAFRCCAHLFKALLCLSFLRCAYTAGYEGREKRQLDFFLCFFCVCMAASSGTWLCSVTSHQVLHSSFSISGFRHAPCLLADISLPCRGDFAWSPQAACYHCSNHVQLTSNSCPWLWGGSETPQTCSPASTAQCQGQGSPLPTKATLTPWVLAWNNPVCMTVWW